MTSVYTDQVAVPLAGVAQVDLYHGVAAAAVAVHQLREPHVPAREPARVVERRDGAQLAGLRRGVPALHAGARPAPVARLENISIPSRFVPSGVV